MQSIADNIWSQNSRRITRENILVRSLRKAISPELWRDNFDYAIAMISTHLVYALDLPRNIFICLMPFNLDLKIARSNINISGCHLYFTELKVILEENKECKKSRCMLQKTRNILSLK